MTNVEFSQSESGQLHFAKIILDCVHLKVDRFPNIHPKVNILAYDYPQRLSSY